MPSSLFGTLNISRTDILSRLRDLDVVSNNVGNVNTSGFKSNRSNFQELLNKKVEEGTRIPNTQIMLNQGSLVDSDSPLDWAIQGEGFFSVTLPNGDTGYTRDGEFKLDANRAIVNANGYPLTWNGTVPDTAVDINIQTDGTVTATDADGAVTEIGNLELTRFPNATGLTGYGDNVWLESDSSGAAQTGAPGADGFGIVVSHKVEQSNVNLGRELSRLMTLQRSFGMSISAFQQTDNMISLAINLRKA